MKSIKTAIFITVTAALVVALTVDAQGTAESVRYSLRLCYEAVIPALFPLFILCSALGEAISALPLDPSAGLFLTSLATGFPTGVRAVCEAYRSGAIGRERANALLYCTANASPAYLYAFIGVCIAGSGRMGAILLIAQTACAFTVALAMGCFAKAKKRAGAISLTQTAVRSAEGAVKGVLSVCGYVILFGVFADAVKGAGPLAAGAFEMSRGVKLLDFTEPYAPELCAVIAGFSGVSVILQCAAYVIPSGLSMRALLTGRVVCTALMPLTVHFLKGAAEAAPDARGAEPFITPALFVIFLLFCGAAAHNIFDKRKKMIYNKKGDENDLFKRHNARMRILRVRPADRND